MRKVYMTPTLSESMNDLTNSIHQCVFKLSQHLSKFGYELTEDQNSADITAGHAGQGALQGVDVAHCSGLYPTGMLESERWHWAANRAVIKNLTGALEITVPSRWVAEIIERDMHISPTVIGWAVDANEWQPGKPQPYVLWNKTRADSTCDPTPMNELARRFPNLPFVSTFGAQADNVHLTGRVNHAEMRALVQNAGVYLATTKETFGIGTLEAMASGTPILGYRWGGTADIIEHGVTGYLAEPGNLTDLAQGLDYCLTHRKTLGANARSAAMGYSWESVAQQMAAVYDRAWEAKYTYPQDTPLVSVVIPLHNYARFVRTAIESVLAQEASFPFEVVIVDDDSQDNPLNEISPLLEANKGIVHYYRLEQNSGVAIARNYGIAQARGKYIVALDADDRLGSPDFLQTLTAALDENRELGIAYTGLAVMDENGENVTPQEWPGEFDFDRQAARANQVPTCCAFRKEAWQRAGGYRRRFTPAEDAHLWLTITSLGYQAARVTREPMFHYRMHSNSLSTPIRTGQSKEPDWTLYAPWVKDGKRPFAAGGKTPLFSWAVRNYDQPLVSVIIPVGPGHVTLLREALDSVEGQTFRFWECIVINDTGEAIPESIKKAYPWVKWVGNFAAWSLGAGKARNAGIENAKAPFIAFLDADDILEPTFLDDMLKGYYTGAGEYVYSDWYSITKDGYQEVNETPEFDQSDVFQRTSIHAVNILIPRDYLLHVGMFDESMQAWEDVDLFMKLAAAGICGRRVAKPLFTYRYATGKRRETGEQSKGAMLAILQERYGDYIKGVKMCAGCDGVSAPLNTFVSYGGFMEMAQSGNNADMIEAIYHGATAPIELIGPATGQNYGRRQNGEIFLVWRADLDSDPEMFQPIGAKMQAGSEVAPTPPPAPTPIDSPTGELVMQTAEDVLADLTDEQRESALAALEAEMATPDLEDGPDPDLVNEGENIDPNGQPPASFRKPEGAYLPTPDLEDGDSKLTQAEEKRVQSATAKADAFPVRRSPGRPKSK